jgi:hypothetical protein
MTRTPPEDPRKIMERLDALLARTEDPERLRMGMGIRLALGMAQELREGAALGSRTADLAAAWVSEHGQDAVDRAVQIAREFLLKPEELRKALGQRLGKEGTAVSAEDDAGSEAGQSAESGAEAEGDA